MKTIIYILRHGQYESPNHVVPYRLPGFHLSQKGIVDVSNVAMSLASRPIVAVHASPLERTHETASILAKQFNLLPVLDERLLETRSPAQGEKEGFVEARGGWGFYETNWYTQHHGEKKEEIVARMKAVLFELVGIHSGNELIVVSHGDPIMLVVAGLRGIPLTSEALEKQPYVPMAGGYVLVFEGDKPVDIFPFKAVLPHSKM